MQIHILFASNCSSSSHFVFIFHKATIIHDKLIYKSIIIIEIIVNNNLITKIIGENAYDTYMFIKCGNL